MKILNLNYIRLLMLGTIVVLSFSLFKECEKSDYYEKESRRYSNNLLASKDSIETYKLDKETWRSEKRGYKLTIKELNSDYKSLLGKFSDYKDKSPKAIVKTNYITRDSLIYLTVDKQNDSIYNFSDSTAYNKNNFRIINGKLNTYSSEGEMDLELGMNLDIGVFENKKDGVLVKVHTDYPNVNFTNIEGAVIENNRDTRSLRRSFGIGLQVGYGLNISGESISYNPYIGVGVSYTPKFLQFGK